jgi:hypothetical protein
MALIVSKTHDMIKTIGEKSHPPSLNPIGSKNMLRVVYPFITAKNV